MKKRVVYRVKNISPQDEQPKKQSAQATQTVSEVPTLEKKRTRGRPRGRFANHTLKF